MKATLSKYSVEMLKASGYDILATCGGIALCATCRVQVLKRTGKLLPANGREMDILDILPDTNQYSRLACQLWINQEMNGMVFVYLYKWRLSTWAY